MVAGRTAGVKGEALIQATDSPRFEAYSVLTAGVRPTIIRAIGYFRGQAMRYVLTILAAALFVALCWLMSDSVYSEPRMLAGPVILFRSLSWNEDFKVGAVLMLIFLPCIFTVGVRTNAVTVVLSIFGCLCWVAFGFWVEAMASV